MKFSVVTTFNEKGYKKYGKRMIQTFLKNWPKSVNLYVYAEECEISESADNLIVLDLCTCSPELVAFKEKWGGVPKANGKKAISSSSNSKDTTENKGIGYRWDAVRFSHKVYAIFHCAKNCESDALVWIDGDSVCHSPISLMQLQLFCPSNVDLAFLGRKALYTECGLYYLNLRSERTRQFLEEFQLIYDNADKGIFQLEEWHDSFVFDHVRKKVPSLKELNWTQDLSEDVHHPLVNSFWGGFIDHLKGDRKEVGRSYSKDLKFTQELNYWGQGSKQVMIFLPRLDLPWKPIKSGKQYPILAEDVLDLRLYWKEFTIRLANALEYAGISVGIEELPAWEITRQVVEARNTCLALIPHRCYLDFEDGQTSVMFYMQEYFRSVFVIDKKGWSAASSKYPFKLADMEGETGQSFDIYLQRLQTGELGSKFTQTLRQNPAKLIAQGDIPFSRKWLGPRKKRPYIFFPLQIPHDQSIRYFSDISELPLVEALVKWAKANNIAVVLKPHPANRKVMKQFEKFVDGHTIFWSEAHVYDLIHHATAVYTINSGVGFEALLQSKPVVTFGRVEYDCVTFQATINRLDEAWKYCCTADVTELTTQYRCFINWFMENYAVDLSQPELAMKRLNTIAEDIVSLVKRDASHVSLL